jgi:hypothetical protein
MKQRLRRLALRTLLLACATTFSSIHTLAWAQQSSAQAASTASAVAPTTSETGPLAAKSSRIWRVQPFDHNVREILSRWSSEAGWQLSWEVQNDVELHATASFQGTFEEALEQFLSSLQGSDYPLSACTYDNRVVRVVTSTLTCERK